MELKATPELRFVQRGESKILQQKYVHVYYDENGNGDMEAYEGEEEWQDVPIVDEADT